jgi:RecJ-like exonuclease
MTLQWRASYRNNYLKKSHYGIEKLRLIDRRGTDVILSCGYCRGKGIDCYRKDKCPVCSGSGKVTLEEPVVGCAYCDLKGRAQGSSITCIVCKGAGVLKLDEPHGNCPKCRGRGRFPGQSLPCLKCRGIGTITLDH